MLTPLQSSKLIAPEFVSLFNEGLVNAQNWDNHIIQDISWAWSGFMAFKQQGPTAMSY